MHCSWGMEGILGSGLDHCKPTEIVPGLNSKGVKASIRSEEMKITVIVVLFSHLICRKLEKRGLGRSVFF